MNEQTTMISYSFSVCDTEAAKKNVPNKFSYVCVRIYIYIHIKHYCFEKLFNHM